MRRFPYPSHPLGSPHSNLYSSNDYHPIFPQYRPSQTPRSVITIPVFDSPTPASPSPSPKQPPAVPCIRIDPASAATLIQSCFRGFSIRRHHPLLHLRTISASRKQLEDLKAELESSGFSYKVRSNEKERLRFSESIMAVILHLDAIEGSIPEVRSQRKEATKTAIKLQDTMDAIISQQEEKLGSKSVDGALPGVGYQTEGFLCSQVNLPQEATPSVQEEGRDVNMVQEATPTTRAAVPDTVDASMIQEETQGGNSDPLDVVKHADELSLEMEDVTRELADRCGVQDKHVEVTDGMQDVPVGALVEAKDNVGHDTSCSQAAIHDSSHGMEGSGIHATGRDGACALEGSSIGVRMNGAIQNMQDNTRCVGVNEGNEEIANVVSANGIADKSYEHTNGCGDDVKGSILSLGTPCGENQFDAVRSVTDDSSTMVENEPSLTEQFHNKTPTEINAVCGDGLQDLHEVIPTIDAPPTETNTLCGGGLQIHTLPGDGVLSSLDSELFKQLSEECGQLKSLLGKLLAQSKAQSKAICALGARLEMLEHQQQLGCQNNRQQGKRKLKKGTKRSVRCRNTQ